MPKLKVADHEFYFHEDTLIVKSPVSMVRVPKDAALALFDMIGAICLTDDDEVI